MIWSIVIEYLFRKYFTFSSAINYQNSNIDLKRVKQYYYKYAYKSESKIYESICICCEYDKLAGLKFLKFKGYTKWSNYEFFETCCEHGSLQTLKWLLENIDTDPSDHIIRIYKYSLKHENLEILNWISQQNVPQDIDFTSYVYDACIAGNLEIVMKLVDIFKITNVGEINDDVLRYTCYYGHLHVAQWLVEHFNLNIDDIRSNDNFILRKICDNGHIDILKWVIENFDITINDLRTNNNYALRWSFINGHFDIVDYLFSKFNFKDSDCTPINYAINDCLYNPDITLLELKKNYERKTISF